MFQYVKLACYPAHTLLSYWGDSDPTSSTGRTLHKLAQLA